MKNKTMISILLFIGISLIAGEVFSETNHPNKAYDLLKNLETGYEQFEEIEIGDKIVYFYQRVVGNAIVEKDFIVYYFNKDTQELIAKNSHWREDIPENLPEMMVTKEQAEAVVGGEVQYSKLYYISPESDVFPIKPAPRNPCWVVRSIDNGNLTETVVDAVDGKIWGNAIPPPYTGFSMTGPWYFDLCSGFWESWYENAAEWFDRMGYSTESTVWPTEEKIKSHIQSSETAMFYEIAHSEGRSDQFKSGCVDGTDPEYTYASEIKTWIADYQKMPFAFLASCYALCDTGEGTLSHEFRKGSTEKTVTLGYCNMSEEQCADCWTYSLSWQDTLFFYLSQGWTVKQAFDKANLAYPACAIPNCMRFAGDVNFAVIPTVAREPVECGDTITQDKTLHNDLLDCVSHGLIINADSITIDCDGHLIQGDEAGIDYGIYLNHREGITIKNCKVQGFEIGINLDSSCNNNLERNTLRDNSYGVYLGNSQNNTFRNNKFIDNVVNAYEDSISNNNDWNPNNSGNFWSDCYYNPGYPDYYEISGPGDGVDHYPDCPNTPPGLFSLLSPSDSSLIFCFPFYPMPYVPCEVTFDWEDAVDPDPWDDTIRYDLYISTSSVFSPDSTTIYNSLLNSQYTDTLALGSFFWTVRAYDNRSETWAKDTLSFCFFEIGDANCNNSLSVSDVVYIINYLFKSGLPPCGMQAADVTCDGRVTVSDVIYLINYLFKGGPPNGC